LVFSCSDGDASADGHTLPSQVTRRTAVQPVSEGATASAGGAQGDMFGSFDGGAPTNGAPPEPEGGAKGVGGTASNPGDGEVGALPTCAGVDGAVCGLNLVPPARADMRYFCAEGVLLAQARCPGSCNLDTNACKQGTGTGGGMDGAELFSLLQCRECYANDCKTPLGACESDPWCAAHLTCLETCSLDGTCFDACTQAFPNDPLLEELGACVITTDCPHICAAI
jgi:hypothetical protein